METQQSKLMFVYHRWPGRMEWNRYLVTSHDGEAMLAMYPQYYSRTSNRQEKEEQD